MVNDSGFVTHEDMVKIVKKNKSFVALRRKAKSVGIDFEYVYVCDGYPVHRFASNKECEISLYIDGQDADGKLKIRVAPRVSFWRETDLANFYHYVDKLKKVQKFIKWLSEDFVTTDLPKCSKKADPTFPLGCFDSRFVNAITEKIDAELTSYFGVECCWREGVRNIDNIIVVTEDKFNRQKRKMDAVFCFHVFDVDGKRKSSYSYEFRDWSYNKCYIYKVLPPVSDDEYARFIVRKAVDPHAGEDAYETWAFGKDNVINRVDTD